MCGTGFFMFVFDLVKRATTQSAASRPRVPFSQFRSVGATLESHMPGTSLSLSSPTPPIRPERPSAIASVREQLQVATAKPNAVLTHTGPWSQIIRERTPYRSWRSGADWACGGAYGAGIGRVDMATTHGSNAANKSEKNLAQRTKV